MGVYGLRVAFSSFGPLNLVRTALATVRPETWPDSGSSKRRRLVLWLMFSTSARRRETKPWSPPVKAGVLVDVASATLAAAAAGAEEPLRK